MLRERVAIVTGGAAGLGLAIAQLYYKNGARVALLDINPNVTQVAAKLDPDPARVLPICCDVTDTGARYAAVTKVVSAFGRIDILVNNAGTGVIKSAIDTTEEEWDGLLKLNLKAVFFLSQAVARHMIKQGGGRIINIASQAGMVALDKHVAYMASKSAVIGITKSLAFEWSPLGIRTNAISPTVVLTELGHRVWDGRPGEEFVKKIPARRFARPDEIAAGALYLASDAADMVTGANLVIDGGYTIQ